VNDLQNTNTHTTTGKKQHAKGKQEKENYVCNNLIGEPDVKPSHYYYHKAGKLNR
jgi:hypothetical protein